MKGTMKMPASVKAYNAAKPKKGFALQAQNLNKKIGQTVGKGVGKVAGAAVKVGNKIIKKGRSKVDAFESARKKHYGL